VSYKTGTAGGLGLLIFIAILMHKAPAALGFGTFLHHEGLKKWALIKHLMVFLQN
jgi:zinc transporter ZupT